MCATLGELNDHNKNSWVKQNRQNPDVTTNIKVQVTLDEKDETLWSVMDQATYVLIHPFTVSLLTPAHVPLQVRSNCCHGR